MRRPSWFAIGLAATLAALSTAAPRAHAQAAPVTSLVERLAPEDPPTTAFPKVRLRYANGVTRIVSTRDYEAGLQNLQRGLEVYRQTPIADPAPVVAGAEDAAVKTRTALQGLPGEAGKGARTGAFKLTEKLGIGRAFGTLFSPVNLLVGANIAVWSHDFGFVYDSFKPNDAPGSGGGWPSQVTAYPVQKGTALQTTGAVTLRAPSDGYTFADENGATLTWSKREYEPGAGLADVSRPSEAPPPFGERIGNYRGVQDETRPHYVLTEGVIFAPADPRVNAPGDPVPNADDDPIVTPAQKPDIREVDEPAPARADREQALQDELEKPESDLDTDVATWAEWAFDPATETFPRTDTDPATVQDPNADPAEDPAGDPAEDPAADPDAPPDLGPAPTESPSPGARPQLDFSPINRLTPCDQFPFGVPCWVLATAQNLNAAAETPSFAMPLGIPGLSGEKATVDLHDFDDGMALLRAILAVGLAVGLAYKFMSLARGGSGGSSPDGGGDE